MLTGVAGGIARRLGIHPIYIRAAFLSAMLAGGVGLVVYVLASLIVPEAKEPLPPHPTTMRQKFGVGAMFLAGMLFVVAAYAVWTNIPTVHSLEEEEGARFSRLSP